MQTGTENQGPDIKKQLPRGYGPEIARRSHKSLPFVYDVLNGKKFNAIVLSEAIKLAKEEARAKASITKEIQSLTTV
jgi:hypothetical protein